MNVSVLVEESLVQLLFTEPILAHFISRIGYTITDNKDLPYTAWTDGKTITINKYGIEETNKLHKIDKNQMIFILSHEAMHLLMLSEERGKQINVDSHERWNAATDYEINNLLVKDKIGVKPSWVLYNQKYKNKTAEEIYNLLEEDEINNHQPIKLDRHIAITDNITKENIKQQIREIIHTNSFSTTKSDIIEKLNDYILKPLKFNWKEALNKYFKSYIKSNYSWNKPNRSGIYRHLILPSTSTTPKIKIALAVDTSGSISQKELNTLLNHISTILHQFKTFDLDVWCFSTEVHTDTFTSFNERNTDLSKFKLQSDGGTNISSNFKFVKEHYRNNKPDVLLIFSDFEDKLNGDTTTRFDYCSCVWLVIDHKNFVQPKLIKAERFDYQTEK